MAAVVKSLGSLGPWIKKGEWTDSIEYLVTGCANRFEALAALNSQGYGYNSVHPQCLWLLGADVSPTEDGAGGYKFQVSYVKSDGITSDPNPLNRPPLLTFKYGMIQEPCDCDIYNNTIINTAGDPFNPPQTDETPVIFIHELKYFAVTSTTTNGTTTTTAAWNPTTALGYIGRVNNDQVTIAGLGQVPKHSVRCLNYAPANSFYLNSSIIAVAAEFEYRPNGFDRNIINKGFQAWYKDKSGTVKKGKLVNKTSLQPIPEAVLLNGAGIPLYTDNVTVIDTNLDKTTMWNHSHTNPIPTYVQNNVIPMTAGGYLLPYALYKEADFSFFATKGY